MSKGPFSLRSRTLIACARRVRPSNLSDRLAASRQTRSSARRGRSQDSGYALLLVLCMMTIMLITSMAVMVDRRTEGLRERETQMIWRGNQFVRAIRLYYRRTGHYPQDLDMLKKGVANIHFIRPEALSDPMNQDGDGKWRFIYTNPTGQIIGSVKYATMQQMAILDLYGAQFAALEKAHSDQDNGAFSSSFSAGVGSSTGKCPPGTSMAPASSSANQAPVAQSLTSTPGQLLPPSAAPTSALGGFSLGGQQSTTAGQPQDGCVTQLPGMPAMAPAAIGALLKMKPTGPVDSPVIGGFLVGVGSTVDRKSLKVYKGGKKYKQWEFIYNPIEEQARAVQQGLSQTGTGGFLGTPGPGNGLPGPATTVTGGIGTSPLQAPPSFPQPPQNQQQ